MSNVDRATPRGRQGGGADDRVALWIERSATYLPIPIGCYTCLDTAASKLMAAGHDLDGNPLEKRYAVAVGTGVD